jgi:hypothetical protein
MKTFILFLFLLPSVAFAQWTTEQRTLAAITATAFVIDYGQTNDLVFRQRHRDCSVGCYTERNPILGRHPTRARMNAYFALTPVVTYLVLDNINSESRTWALRGLTAIEIAAVGNNIHLGLSVRI